VCKTASGVHMNTQRTILKLSCFMIYGSYRYVDMWIFLVILVSSDFYFPKDRCNKIN
jgi:hypothetical protein